MHKKLISSILVVALPNLVGCYSTSLMNPYRFQDIKDETQNPNKITINMLNRDKYKFARGDYFIK